MLLLSDGTVMVLAGYTTWYRLTPDSLGSYVNGTWSQTQPSLCQHSQFASQVLPDGTVFVAGGELPNPAWAPGPEPNAGIPGCANPTTEIDTGVDTEIYDPVANSWTMADPPLDFINPATTITFPSFYTQPTFADMTSTMLPDGTVLMVPVTPMTCGDTLIFNKKLYNPNVPGSGWSDGGTLANSGANGGTETWASCSAEEATWIKLSDGSVLTIDAPLQPPNPNVPQTSERYVFSQHKWVADSSLMFPVFEDNEEGPAFLLPDGTALFVGGSGFAAHYTPASASSPSVWSPIGIQSIGCPSANGAIQSTGCPIPPPATAWSGNSSSWQTFPVTLSADDVPGAMMANGKVLLALNYFPLQYAPWEWPKPWMFFEYDYKQETFTEVPGPMNPDAPSPWTDCGAIIITMLDLPDGTVLMPSGCDNTQLYVYQPDSSPLQTGQPKISSITVNPNGSYHLVGSGLNGISEGASFGDDAQMASNYPLVRLAQSDAVRYARTYNWSTSGVMTGTTPVSTEFVLPLNVFERGVPYQYSLVAVANGNPSEMTYFCTPAWMNFSYSGPLGNGSFNQPLSSPKQFASGVPTCGVVPVVAINATTQPSTSPWTGTLSKPMSIISVCAPSSSSAWGQSTVACPSSIGGTN